MPQSNPLGEFLRARRARVTPAQAGLPATVGRRRTPGLRREELAALAGLSVDYYTRLEQGRERNPGPAVVEALATALRLDPDERDHFGRLTDYAAGRRTTRPQPPPSASRPALDLLERVRPWPALLLARNGDVLAANPEGLALYAGLSEWPARRRNTVRYTFLHPAARSVLGDWEGAAAMGVANLHHWTSADPDAPDLRGVRDELAEASADFRRLWDRHHVRPRRSSHKLFHHPAVGDLRMEHQVWYLDHSPTRLSLYQPEPAHTDQVALLALSLDTPANVTRPGSGRTGLGEQDGP
ncbi:helix-turn-helix transcriptional regulator [Sphaerisporangium krabiense]|uniref:Transcriptional regulator with XRE-family HTH domain n=1 Tax=Sphaerisporangium krabiense TaxID=763782 RepID=A0A7W8Z8Z5_9ACTN|nr:helix-turn-helix transcriptional regulator [Sphaerisporangium krabiense]MBB5629671.1 transcriptional regulator with XRE-family HTH domain [Sphaerisporangium krabiense]